MEVKEKPPCNYGLKCYRKNPKHFEEYSHPLDFKQHDTSVSEEEHQSKRIKTEKDDIRTKRKFSTVLKKPQGTTKQTTLKFCYNEASKGVDAGPKQLLNRGNGSLSKFKHGNDLEEIKGNCLNDSEDKSSSWKFVEKPKTHGSSSTETNFSDFSNKSFPEIIKALFLVDMPNCFYSFYDFCKSINSEKPESALDICGIKLVGPFDVLLGKENLIVDQNTSLCHWRFYYDPPEFQTILNTTSGTHIGYWRDEPQDPPVFLASNNFKKDCVFKIEGENVFGAVFHYLENYIKTSVLFNKTKIMELQSALSQWAMDHNFSLEKNSKAIMQRQKKVVAKTFHKLGIVVKVDKKTKLGYRPLLETDASLKKICKLIIEAEDDTEREAMWENLQPLINAANIANDECDFGNSLELGIDLFCMGSSIFNETVEHLLTTSYTLLGRMEFEKIIKAHLKRRNFGKEEWVI